MACVKMMLKSYLLKALTKVLGLLDSFLLGKTLKWMQKIVLEILFPFPCSRK